LPLEELRNIVPRWFGDIISFGVMQNGGLALLSDDPVLRHVCVFRRLHGINEKRTQIWLFEPSLLHRHVSHDDCLEIRTYVLLIKHAEWSMAFKSVTFWVMPEAAEVRRIADWLQSNLVDRVIRSVVPAGRFVKQPIDNIDSLNNKRVVGVRCKGKVIVIDFENDVSAISTLGMTGRWTRAEAPHVALTLWCELPPTRGMSPIYFVDQRRFGNFVVTNKARSTTVLDELGWDSLAHPTAYGKAKLRARKYDKRKTPVCQVLLDQDVFAGCGNYLRAETLFRARINPWREWRLLSESEKDLVCVKLAEVCAESYSRGGATLENFLGGDAERGDQVDFLEVYGRTHDPYGNPVTRKKDKSGRTVWWSPMVQP
jgi:DNA-formamidopyrimidine glycosylase